MVIGYDSTYEKKRSWNTPAPLKTRRRGDYGRGKGYPDVSRYMNFPLYSNAQIRIISMPEISEGAIVDYRARTTQNQLINKEGF